MKDRQNKDKKIFVKFEQEIEEKKKLPEAEKKKVKKIIISGGISFLLLSFYLIIIKILEENIPTGSYLIVLKSFSLISCLITIVMMEISYKKNKNSLILLTIELLITTLLTIFLISAYSIYYGQFYKVIIITIIIGGIYFLLKTFINVKMIKRGYKKSLIDIKTIVAK